MRRWMTLASAALLLTALIPTVARAAPFGCLNSGTTIRGTNGNDTIYGTNYRDVISALGGADAVHALGGDDRVCGDAGADVISDGFGQDIVDGGDAYDTLYLCPDGASDRWVNVERVVPTNLGCR